MIEEKSLTRLTLWVISPPGFPALPCVLNLASLTSQAVDLAVKLHVYYPAVFKHVLLCSQSSEGEVFV